MLERIRRRVTGKLAWVVIGIIIIPFLFFGVDRLFATRAPEQVVATVGGTDINTELLARVYDDQRRRFTTDNTLPPQLARLIANRALEQLIAEQAVRNAVRDQGFVVNDAQLADDIRTFLPSVGFQGEFSREAYLNFLRVRGIDVERFEQYRREVLSMQQFFDSITAGVFVIDPFVDDWVRQQREARQISYVVVDPATFSKAVTVPDDEALRQYYSENSQKFMTPPRVSLAYVTTAVDDIRQTLPNDVDDATLQNYFAANESKYGTPARRRASHILISGNDAAARQQADDLLAQLRDDPSRFAELARQYSADPGSGAQGGDLGFFTRDMMVKPFADAVFATLQQPGQISDIVASQFGLHIIRLDAIDEAKSVNFTDVRDRVRDDYLAAEARAQYDRLAGELSQLALRYPAGLDEIAAQTGLTIQQTASFTADDNSALPPMMRHEQIVNAAFSDNVLAGQNSQLIEIDGRRAFIIHQNDYQLAELPAFEVVRAAVIDDYRRQQGTIAYQNYLDAVEQGEQSVDWQQVATPLTQSGDYTADPLLRAAASVAFDTAAGRIVTTSVDDGRTMVLRVDAIRPFSGEISDEMRQEARLTLTEAMRALMAGALESTVIEQADVERFPQHIDSWLTTVTTP